MDKGYSHIYEDQGYTVMDENSWIDRKFPYKYDINPRLIRYIRTSYYYKKNKILPCVPLELEYRVSKNDQKQIKRYLKKYRIEL